MSLGVNELKPKTFFIYEGQPYVVLETHHLKMQQRRPTVQTKMRNLINGKILERNFAQSDVFEEADVQRMKVKYLYGHTSRLPAGRQGQYWFSDESDSSTPLLKRKGEFAESSSSSRAGSKRFELSEEVLGETTKFLKPNTIMEAVVFEGKIITVELPVKMEFKVVEAPPAIRGDTAQGGVKQVKIETGATLNVPLFIGEGDIVRVNTETGEYTERVEKGK